MSNINIAIINPNSYHYQHKHLDINKIYKDLEKLIIYRAVDSCHLMDEIYSTLKMKPNYLGDTDTVYENDEEMVQMCYLSLENNNEAEDLDQINSLGSLFLQKKVFGTVIILYSKINQQDYKCYSENIDNHILASIYYAKHVHVGIYTLNNNISEYGYFTSPLQHKSLKKDDQYMVTKFNIFNFYLNAFYKKESDEPVNKIASRIIGKKVFGPVIFCAKCSETEYIDLDENLFMELYRKSCGPLKRRIVENPKYVDHQLQKINNGYCILKVTKEHDECNHCKKTTNLSICTGCYRVYYDSKECQQKDRCFHKDECNETLNLK
jgi:hypothetical protein